MKTRVAIVGVTGTMGRLVSRLVEESDDYELVAGLNSRSDLSEMLGAEVVIDLTLPGVSQSVVDFAVDHGLRVLVGTSGWSQSRIDALATRVVGRDDLGVVIIPNFSIGSVIATGLAVQVALVFDSIEIIEAHQAGKVDSPSGTAVRTAELIGRARAEIGPVSAPHIDQRARGQQVSSIPVHSLRLDGMLARQDVIFGGAGETLTISHNTLSAASYERGILLALAAARTAVGVTVGLDQIIDLGLSGSEASGSEASGSEASGSEATGSEAGGSEATGSSK
ncbi:MULTISPECIES: 4-hydroxy-tetrahydrodipicolinate reductase [Cryobacterium]|uniref:4-hydroxy-tetrahydrodipicolinate reductase n=1 Tax=Cryobacterium breve TaxID=1259258 RepID=A0ABY2J9D1_9MICO|nr:MULTISPECIES: 4-hydroxy-tetrahydrodipicolinate reductase [Cryobacterium]TFC97809.1 4-hydroxy-tetrahydrodipicolinate reductase [Cryobacterium sp. TmT3-12]TFD01557.1 4-hydroxy-tetrahydrodipicolinate reductase [Cryobacterium breve]